KSCEKYCASAPAIKWSGRRVWISTVAPVELPGYSAEYGPYSTSTDSIDCGDTMPQRGAPPQPLVIRLESNRPSAYTRLRALCRVPASRLLMIALGSPM